MQRRREWRPNNLPDAVDRELVLLYGQIDKQILARQDKQRWGAKVTDQVRKDLTVSFATMKGFSTRNRDHALAQKYLGGRPSEVLTFGVQGGRDGGARFQGALKLFTRLVNIGDAKSLACHPANRLCGSSLDAVGTAARAIRAGELEFAIAGGVESMSRAPCVTGLHHVRRRWAEGGPRYRATLREGHRPDRR